MRFKFSYTQNADFPERNIKDYSHGKYECKQLLHTRKGLPVAVFHNTDLDIWKVQYGFSTVYFGGYDEAIQFCKKRFESNPQNNKRRGRYSSSNGRQ